MKALKKKAKKELKSVKNQPAKGEFFDITVPGKRPVLGHLHPLTQTKRQVEEIFQSMGFAVVYGPDIETEWYNFDALNIPKDHPARDAWDTFWLKTENAKIKNQNSKLLLRTHTSPVQIRYMEKHQPPLRIIVPGNVYRHEATDASHEFQLYQVEGLMIDKNISAANFKSTVDVFFSKFFGKKIETRLRPDFFPFTEPSFDISIRNGLDWLEVAGAGMVHPNVLRACGLNPKHWQGWAFGFGLERLTMMKYKINDIRLFRGGDLRFLNQF